jgi:hypothetical protein
MLDIGGRAEIDNFGSIGIHGARTVGIEAIGSHGLPAGENITIVNRGQITTEGDRAIGVALGLPIVPPGTTTDSAIANTGGIKTNGDGAAGVVMFGNNDLLTNSGQIATNGGAFDDTDLGVTFDAAGVLVSGDGAVIENRQTGVIESKNSASAAVELNVLQQDGVTNSATSSFLENYGLIKGAQVAVLGGAGEETVINHGRIVGNVLLGDGNDAFVSGKGSSFADELFLGGGDDLVRVEKGSSSLRIADFSPGNSSGDVIDISAFYSNFTDLMSHSHQVGDNVIIDLGHNDQLVLENVNQGALTAGDFQFNASLLGSYMASSFAPSGSLSSGVLVADAGTTENGPNSQHLAARFT